MVLNDCVVTNVIDNLLDLNKDVGCHKISNKTGFFLHKNFKQGAQYGITSNSVLSPLQYLNVSIHVQIQSDFSTNQI